MPTISQLLDHIEDSEARDILEESQGMEMPWQRALARCVRVHGGQTSRLIATHIAGEVLCAQNRVELIAAVKAAERNMLLPEDVVRAVIRCC